MRNLILIMVMVIMLAGCGFLMAGMSTKAYQVELDVELTDKFGKPLQGVEVELWKYDYLSQYCITDNIGRVTFNTVILENALSRPEAIDIPIRLRFDSHQKNIDDFLPVYYRFEVNGLKREVPYNVFISSYDYCFGGTWAGTFYSPEVSKEPEFSKSIVEGFSLKSCKAVPLRAPGRYDDENKYIDGKPLSAVDAFEIRSKVVARGKDQIKIQLNIQHKGYWKYHSPEKS